MERRVGRFGDVGGGPVPETVDIEGGQLVLNVGSRPKSFPEVSDLDAEQKLLESHSVRARNETSRVVRLRR